eukprot:CAMPEP_0203008234 /NCGR_PEP_ID=MMETSP1401-20130829/7455_1 /ASSEMBLY_ACC=CAM_ASM_000894 /TAXON_ID=38833 /ORGANISM="Micromonas pusilla, Strain CCAC1681" /LENGTH=134 /DNA_ID=CAMNT_0049749895 /DNA_START=157 /DNA_END=557 /DNA_ORIENTATION=-
MRIPPPKKRIDTPGSVKLMVDKMVATPALQLADVFPPFAWTFGKGDLMHWVPVLNHFDAFFETHVAAREDEDANKNSPQTGFASASFPAEPTRWIVRASCVILENCANKHVYDSCEHLGLLLSCDDAQVALDAL